MIPPHFYYLAWLAVERQYDKAMEVISEMEVESKALSECFFQNCMTFQREGFFSHEHGSELISKALAKMEGFKQPRTRVKVIIEEVESEL